MKLNLTLKYNAGSGSYGFLWYERGNIYLQDQSGKRFYWVEGRGNTYNSPPPDLRAGESRQMSVVIEAPPDPSKPWMFHFLQNLEIRGIQLLG